MLENQSLTVFKANQPGTYWYHSHDKGQYPDGLRGAFVITDPDFPYQNQTDAEVTISFSDWYHDEMQVLIPKFLYKANPTGAEPIPNSALMNDTQNLTISVQPGKTYLFHLVNIAAFAGQHVWFEGHNMTIVEVDGIYTDPTEATMLYIAAAQRYSVLVTMKNETTSNFAIVGSMDTVIQSPSELRMDADHDRTCSIQFLLGLTGTSQDGSYTTAQIPIQHPLILKNLRTLMTSPWFRMIRRSCFQSQTRSSLLT